jgi:hypothetical protein
MLPAIVRKGKVICAWFVVNISNTHNKFRTGKIPHEQTHKTNEQKKTNKQNKWTNKHEQTNEGTNKQTNERTRILIV